MVHHLILQMYETLPFTREMWYEACVSEYARFEVCMKAAQLENGQLLRRGEAVNGGR